MKPTSSSSAKKNGYQSDDENVRYKINTSYFNNNIRTSYSKVNKKQEQISDDDDVRYKFPSSFPLAKPKTADRKPKQKIKVNFWSTKPPVNRQQESNTSKDKSSRRHTIAATSHNDLVTKPKSPVKVRKRVSFLPSPLFSENHVPMVTVPDDLTIQLNEEEANDLGEDLNSAFLNNDSADIGPKQKARSTVTQISPRDFKRKRNSEDSTSKNGNENELEFFSKYVVQKLRRMETNQRIYSENLINTVLMLGQLGKLNGRSKIRDA